MVDFMVDNLFAENIENKYFSLISAIFAHENFIYKKTYY